MAQCANYPSWVLLHLSLSISSNTPITRSSRSAPTSRAPLLPFRDSPCGQRYALTRAPGGFFSSSGNFTYINGEEEKVLWKTLVLRLSGCGFKGTATEGRVSGLDRVVSGGVSRGEGGMVRCCMRYSTVSIVERGGERRWW